MHRFSTLLSLILLTLTSGFPDHQSLAGLSRKELESVIPTLRYSTPSPPPGPLNDTKTKLVNDALHPWRPAGPGEIRGPCPGLNTLANHGWLPRSGIATPGQIIQASQEAFNMGNDLAKFVTYAAMLVDGNPITNLLSIGQKSVFTGPDPPKPAIVGGLNTHAVFEGDASLTRGDAFFGDDHSFNQTLFNELVSFSNRFGAGKYNLTVASELRFQRIQDGIATNPNFSFVSPRIFTGYAEAVFPTFFFVDGRKSDGQLSMDVAEGFFKDGRMPGGFFRANESFTLPITAQAVLQIFGPHPVEPGNNNGINNYTLDPTSADISNFCKLYSDFLNVRVKGLYPDPTPKLRDALNTNMNFLFEPIQDVGCPQVFPFGQ